MSRTGGVGVAWLAWWGLVFAAACGGDPGGSPDTGGSDAGGGGTPDAGMGRDGGDGTPDAGMDGDGGVDAPPVDPGPFPANPKGGELAWFVSMNGAAGPSVAVDPQGNIFVVATQTGVVSLGSVHVPQPASGGGLLVLKLKPDGTPIWGRSVMSAPAVGARSIAVTPAGDVVIGGTLRTGSSYETADGFVIAIDGDDGATRWSKALTNSQEDHVAGIAAGLDATNVTAIYVYGKLAQATVVDGQTLPAGAYLLRYDESGTRRWAQSFPRLDPAALALDPQRGPVITGTFAGDLTLGDQVLTAEADGSLYGEDAVVAGFDPDGQLRFARQIFSDGVAWTYDVAVAPSGDIYVASYTSSSEVVVDDHAISFPGYQDLFLLRLTPAGRYASSSVVHSSQIAWPAHVTTDAAGASYLLGTCNGQIDVQPEITCASGSHIIVSYDASHEYQWATYVTLASLRAIAPAPGNRLIVAGRAQSSTIDFGGVQLPTQELFIAALAGGPARLPSPLPAAPAISSVKLDGSSDRELRQGGTGTLVIQGAGLDRVTKARLGDLDVHVPAGAGTAGELRLPVTIPHGHAPGWLGLTLGNAGGSIQTANAVRVTPVVVSPLGTDSGRGTLTSPLRLCTPDLFERLHYGDVLLLRDGIHACNRSIIVRRGVTVRGESKAGAIIRGTYGGGSGDFEGFFVMSGSFGASVIENMTIESGNYAVIRGWSSGTRLAVTDVDIRGVSGSGIWISGGASATVTRYRYQQGSSTGLVIEHGHVDASQVAVSDAYKGVLMIAGTLDLTDSVLSSRVEVGSEYGTNDVTIARTTLRSGLAMRRARVTVIDSTIAPASGSTGYIGVYQRGGALTLTDSIVRGWSEGCISAGPDYTADLDDPWGAVSLTLDRAELGCGWGVSYYTWRNAGRFSLRSSYVRATAGAAVTLSGGFTAADLGTAASPGDNQLESAPGSPALQDNRVHAGAAVDAHGTTLNGMTYGGDVLGPVDVSGAYRIAGPNTFRF